MTFFLIIFEMYLKLVEKHCLGEKINCWSPQSKLLIYDFLLASGLITSFILSTFGADLRY